ncbi:hypothetical protein Pint_36690 [Pistacia integerrima]|uniref:Uncharacterized protein n=1 Tax=Pistacia integerrima TaxID=434235 RepID=A0ACC0Y240_9ROSI|nr:hypothetical protein Pint_36690 [Pistacia integerrima]
MTSSRFSCLPCSVDAKIIPVDQGDINGDKGSLNQDTTATRYLSLWFGVPIVAWPPYAEQPLNAFQMVKNLGLAVELKVDYRIMNKAVVVADEIARAIKCVMESDNEVRKKVKEKSEKSRLAVMEGGSSYAAFGDLIDDILRNIAMEEAYSFS